MRKDIQPVGTSALGDLITDTDTTSSDRIIDANPGQEVLRNNRANGSVAAKERPTKHAAFLESAVFVHAFQEDSAMSGIVRYC